jgi:ferritin-like protein
MIDVTHRRRLVALLTEAAELEHALMCQYLYAALSMKRHVEEGVSWQQLELMRRWEASIMLIARQEMEHLGLVCNLLTAIGEAPWLTRPNFPLTPRHYDLEVESKLERLTEETLVRFALFEIPDADIEEPDRALLAKALGQPIDPQRYQTIGRLYDEIAQLLQQLGEELFIGPPGAELATTDVIPVPLRGISLPNTARIYDVELVPVDGLASALAVVEQIVSEGEGSPGSSLESHFKRVLAILREFRDERERDPAFEPARPVTAHPDPHQIANVRTRRVSQLFDEAYATLLLLLMRFFSQSDEDTAELTGLQRAAFFPMMTTVIRPLAEVLTLLPTGADSATAGPAFRFTRNITLIPHRDAAWQVIQGELDALTGSAEDLSGDSGYPDEVRNRLNLMSENLARIALDFGLAMGTEVAP